MATIAACLIVRDAAGPLQRCLASVRSHVDQVVVYDTGSVDGTLDLLDRLAVGPDGGAAITSVRGEWRDDFAWARERSFEIASADWLMWLDADDVIIGGEALRPIIDAAPPGLDGFVVSYETERDSAARTRQHVWRVRIVRRRAGFRWEGVAHEGLFLSGRSPRLEVVPADRLRVVHEAEAGRRDSTRNVRLLLAAENRGALDRRSLFNLGLELLLGGRFDEAIPRLSAYLEAAGDDWSDERAQAVALLAICLRALGRPREALEAELEAAEHRPDWTEVALGIAESYAALEQWTEAATWAAKARALGVPASPVLLDPERLVTAPLLRLAEAALALGDSERAVSALAEMNVPGERPPAPTLEAVRAALRRHDLAFRAAVNALVSEAPAP